MRRRIRRRYYDCRCVCAEYVMMIERYLPEPRKSDCFSPGPPRPIRQYLHHHLFRRCGRQRRLCDQRDEKARPVQPSGATSQAVRQACLSLACVSGRRTKGSLASSRFSRASSVSTLRLIPALVAQGAFVRPLRRWSYVLCADALPEAISHKTQEIDMRTGCVHHASFLCF